jgi:hypothetical protein
MFKISGMCFVQEESYRFLDWSRSSAYTIHMYCSSEFNTICRVCWKSIAGSVVSSVFTKQELHHITELFKLPRGIYHTTRYHRYTVRYPQYNKVSQVPRGIHKVSKALQAIIGPQRIKKYLLLSTVPQAIHGTQSYQNTTSYL